MAKISELKFDISGTEYKVNVNCTSGGEFTANIPEHIAEALRIDAKIKAETLQQLTKDFFGKLDNYKTVQTTEELFILVAYQARGKYTYKSDGSILFGHSERKHKIDISFGEIDNAVGLDFKIAIKQTIDYKVQWFEAKLGKEFAHFQKEEYSKPDIYHKESKISSHRIERYKAIPFSETALQSLKFAEEKLRIASETLYNFISQDEETILLTLTHQRLLN